MSEYIPELFENRMKDLLGDEFEAFFKGYGDVRYRGLRVNALKENANCEFASVIMAREGLEPIPWAENGYYYGDDRQPGKHPYHEAGVYYIQEPSAMAPVEMLDPKPGETVLDLCAAPGGKSTQIASKLKGKGMLVSNEISPPRSKILSENIERMGINNAVVTNESPESLRGKFTGFFDKILVDAPCSGEGMFRKNEEALEEWSIENVKLCAERQSGILDCAADMLAPGGRLVYSTCTFAPEENERNIYAFLLRHPEFELLSVRDVKEDLGKGCDGRSEWVENYDSNVANISDTVRLWPHRLKGEGHFAAALAKKGEARKINSDTCVSKSDKKRIDEYLGDILKLEEMDGKDTLISCGRLENFGENVYLVPDMMPGLKGLKVLRPGLCLGSVQKNRFEPSHSLALALAPKYARNVVDIDSEKAADYIKGLTWNVDEGKGWALVCVDGYSLGWGKIAGGILKNHYPKGLRKG